jgi:hypothetical protein
MVAYFGLGSILSYAFSLTSISRVLHFVFVFLHFWCEGRDMERTKVSTFNFIGEVLVFDSLGRNLKGEAVF